MLAAELDGAPAATGSSSGTCCPAMTSHIIASLTLSIPGVILAETALSFLGLGLRAPVVSWGVLLQEAQNIRVLATAPWLLLPGRRGGDRGDGAQLRRRRSARCGGPVRELRTMTRPLLEIRGLKTHFSTREGVVRAVDGVDLHIEPGETLCVVGESGCGKSITARSILQLVEPPGRIVGGEIRLRRPAIRRRHRRARSAAAGRSGRSAATRSR